MLRFSDPLWIIIDPDTGEKRKAHALLDTESGKPICFVLETSPSKMDIHFLLKFLPRG